MQAEQEMMETRIQYPSRVVSWDEYLSALRGAGGYSQTQGAMCKIDGDGNKYFCPLGILNDLAGASWEIHGNNDEACDDNGETHLPDPALLETLGLNQMATDEELKGTAYGASLKYMYEGKAERYTVIAYLNDYLGLKFNAIADELERLGWNETGR